jgi:hypothetical protein
MSEARPEFYSLTLEGAQQSCGVAQEEPDGAWESY